MQAWIGCKEQSWGLTSFKPGTYYYTEWLSTNELSLRLDGHTMDLVLKVLSGRLPESLRTEPEAI